VGNVADRFSESEDNTSKDTDAMQCEEALHYWKQQLLGQPVDPAKLEEAFAHIGTCQNLCARTLSIAADFDLFVGAEQRSGQTDLYEALGLRSEEEGDAHARQWRRLRRLASVGKATQEAIDYERVMALAAWQEAANRYQDGLRIGETAFLVEGLKRMKRKRLEPSAPARGPTRSAPRGREARFSARKLSSHLSRATPGESSSTAPRKPQDAWPRLKLVTHASTRQVSVEDHPDDWQIITKRSGSPLVIRERPALYQASTQDIPLREPPQVDGRLDPFELALWANASARVWELDVLVRALTPQRPWSSLLLTLEDQEERRQRMQMDFEQQAQTTGWWARLREVESGSYHLRLSANDPRGQAAEATLELQLSSEA
jgi:hypothetical protein